VKKYAFLFGILFVPATVNAAGLKVCFDPASVDADTAKIQLLADTNVAIPDVLAASSVSGTKRCGEFPLPVTMVKGTDYTLSLKAVNAIGEVSGASNALPFRFPNPPKIPTGFTVQIVTP